MGDRRRHLRAIPDLGEPEPELDAGQWVIGNGFVVVDSIMPELLERGAEAARIASVRFTQPGDLQVFDHEGRRLELPDGLQ